MERQGIRDTPIPGVPLTTRQPAKTCGYRVSRYHTHLSHVLRPIPAYLIHKYTKIYDMLFNQQSIYSPFIQQKGIHELYPALIPYAGKPPALDLYLKGGSHDEVSKA